MAINIVMNPFGSASFNFGGYVGGLPTLATLRNIQYDPVWKSGQEYVVNCRHSDADGNGGIYYWVPSSLDDDDDASTVKPFDVPDQQPGRWRIAVGAAPTAAINEQFLELSNTIYDPTYGNLALEASYSSEVTLRIAGDEASITAIQNLSASVDGQFLNVNSSITNLQSVTSSADQAATQRMDQMTSDYQNLNSQTNATITEDFQTLSTADSAATSRMDSMTSEYRNLNETTNATITQNFSTLSGVNSAATSRMDSMTSEYRNLNTATNSSITENVSTLSGVDSAATTRMDSMTSEYRGLNETTNATISSNYSTLSGVDSAATSRMDAMTSEYQGLNTSTNATISSNYSTLSNQYGSLAQDVQNLQASSDSGLSSRVTATEQAIEGLDGKTAAYWSVETVAGNNRAELTVHADANGGGGVDIVGDVSIAGNLIASGTITGSQIIGGGVGTGNIAGGAVTTTASAAAADQYSTSGQDVIGVTITTQGGPVVIMGYWGCTATPTQTGTANDAPIYSAAMTLNMLRNGATLSSVGYSNSGSLAIPISANGVSPYVDNVGAGSYTYTLNVAGAATVGFRSIVAIELKR